MTALLDIIYVNASYVIKPIAGRLLEVRHTCCSGLGISWKIRVLHVAATTNPHSASRSSSSWHSRIGRGEGHYVNIGQQCKNHVTDASIAATDAIIGNWGLDPRRSSCWTLETRSKPGRVSGQRKLAHKPVPVTQATSQKCPCCKSSPPSTTRCIEVPSCTPAHTALPTSSSKSNLVALEGQAAYDDSGWFSSPDSLVSDRTPRQEASELDSPRSPGAVKPSSQLPANNQLSAPETSHRAGMRRTPAEASTDRDYLERAFTGAAYGSAPDVAAPAVPETSGRSSPNKAPAQSRTDVPVFVMLPLDTVSPDGAVQNPKALQASFQALRVAGVTGVMVDVWWGVVERRGPCLYDWEPYQQIVGMAKKAGLQLQAVMSFHACGGNVGDDIHIPLPQWVHEAAAKDPAIFYTDRAGYQNPECVSLFSDDVPCLAGRTPIQAYTDFMAKFREAMGEDFGTVVREIAVGAGPCGELRYPAYPEGDGRWQFPGVGEFQCYDERALAALRSAAELEGRPHWGLSGPHDSGHYNSRPDETGFFSWDGSWSSDYGQFFLQWYAASLVSHGERMLQAAHAAVYDISPHEPPSADGPAAWGGYPPPGVVKVSIKCAGIHWWYCTRVHAAELTAGYNNTWGRNGYAAIIDLCARYGAHLNFTCCEMRNAEQPPAALCGPQELLNQVRVCAAQKGVVLAGENALARLDHAAYDQMVHNACAGKVTLDEVDELGNVTTVEHHAPAMGAVTFLRLTPSLFQERNFVRFISFIRRMKQGSPAPHRDHDHAHPQDHIMYA